MRSAHSFNVAASIKMRKSIQSGAPTRPCHCLQCGRIYKDAEIPNRPRNGFCAACTFNVAASIKMRKYGLAATHALDRLSLLQCGRIYKDAEMRASSASVKALFAAFNVAASIKMRKCEIFELAECYDSLLQCGRIYKDAEIYIFAASIG